MHLLDSFGVPGADHLSGIRVYRVDCGEEFALLLVLGYLRIWGMFGWFFAWSAGMKPA
jgi:hypothetical protein